MSGSRPISGHENANKSPDNIEYSTIRMDVMASKIHGYMLWEGGYLGIKKSEIELTSTPD